MFEVSAENGIGWPTMAKTVIETRLGRLCLKTDFQNCLKNFPSLNIKKVTDLAYLRVWDCQKRHGMAKNGKTANETKPDWLRLQQDYQNCL